MKNLLLFFLTCLSIGCSDDPTERSCYDENPDPDAQAGSVDLFCARPLDYRPETPEGVDEDAGPFTVTVCGPRADGYCDRCATDELDEFVRAHLLEIMESEDRCAPAQVQHISPECVTTGEGSCCVNAWYWGSCNIKG